MKRRRFVSLVSQLLELFFSDLRSYRGDNSENRQAERSEATALMDESQLQWLKRKLAKSKATWKVICCDMPIGLVVRDGKDSFENGANVNGPASGRELEFVDLFRFIKSKAMNVSHWNAAGAKLWEIDLPPA